MRKNCVNGPAVAAALLICGALHAEPGVSNSRVIIGQSLGITAGGRDRR